EEVDTVSAEQAAAGVGQDAVPQLFEPRGVVVPARVPEQAHHLPECTHGPGRRSPSDRGDDFPDHRAEPGRIRAAVGQRGPRRRWAPGTPLLDACQWRWYVPQWR